MEAYQNPKMLEEPHDWNWSDDQLKAWDTAQYTILGIMRELHLEDEQKAYNLGKNLWHNGCEEDEIREQLTQYAASK